MQIIYGNEGLKALREDGTCSIAGKCSSLQPHSITERVHLKRSAQIRVALLKLSELACQGFFRGIGPRMMLAMPSAAVCWGTYETVLL
eukprot:52518-Amphidinium_carterae.1